METNNEMTEKPLIPLSPVPAKAPKPKLSSLSVPKRNPTGTKGSISPSINPTGTKGSTSPSINPTGMEGSTSPSIYTPNKPVPNYMKTTSHSCHDSCKYGSNHDFESKWTLNPNFRVTRRENEGIRGVVLNPEFRTGGKGKSKSKNRGVEKQGIEKQSTEQSEESLSPVLKDIHEMEMIIPPVEKVFNLSDIQNEISVSNSDSDSKSNYEGLSLNVVGSTSLEESSETVPVIEPVPVELESIESVPIDENDESKKVVKKKKNNGKEVIKSTGTGTGTAQKKGEKKKKMIEREKVLEKASSLKPRKKDAVQKDGTGTGNGTNTVRPRVKEIKSIDDSKVKKRNNTKVVEPITKVNRAVLVKPPAVSPVPTSMVRKFKKDLVGTITSSMENNPSENSNNSDHPAKEKTIYVVESKTVPKKRYQKKNPKSDIPIVPTVPKTRKPKSTNPVPRPPLPILPHKMAFRRGKIVNIQTENSVPVRLKFRRVRPSNESNKAGTSNKSVRKKREVGLFGTTPSTGTGTGTPVVILRRQTGTVKKQSHASSGGLFNHVIEETASKLVEKRKSKVKALVGAFETVISLQEKSVVNNN